MDTTVTRHAAHPQPRPWFRRTPVLIGTVVALAGLAMLAVEHWAHVRGYWPYLLFALCPLMHLFGHGGHGHGAHTKTTK